MVHAAQPPSNSKAPRLGAVEREWRCPTFPACSLFGRIFASRWVGERGFPRLVAVAHGADHHTICLALRPTNLDLDIGGCTIHPSSVMPGIAPGSSAHAFLCDPCDFRHSGFRTGYWLPAARNWRFIPGEMKDLQVIQGSKNDAVITKLTQAFPAAHAARGDLYRGYVGGIASPVVTRLVTSPGDGPAVVKARSVDGFSKWRLKRTLDFIDVHLAEPNLAQHLRQLHGLCNDRGDVATASFVENWTAEGESRVWFLFEATQGTPQ